MKKLAIFITTIFASSAVFGQITEVKPNVTQNYVHKIVYKKGVQQSAIGSVGGNDKIETITYFDGLGRPIQGISVRQGGKDANGNDTDLITPFEYDTFGRQAKDYLPFYRSDNNGKYIVNGIAETKTYNYNKYSGELDAVNPNVFSEKTFEASPLNKVLQQAAPGKAWKMGSGHEIKFDYKTNAAGEVKYYTVTLSTDFTPSLTGGTGYYDANQLYKTVTKDENWKTSDGLNRTTEEFKDKQGRVVLKRTYNNSQKHDTYYVYDEFGNLTYVLSPKMDATTSMLSSVISKLNALGYQYKYDGRNRLIEKKIPGKGWEYIVYNKLDQPIMTQDAILRSDNKWLFTKYDALGRVAFTGFTNTSATRAMLQNGADNTSTQWVTKTGATTLGGTTVYYNNAGYPNLVSEILTIYYYDNYTFNRDGVTVPANTFYDATISGNALKGLATGSKVKVLDTNSWITTITGYDEFRRPIWIGTKNAYLSTTDVVESKLKKDATDISGLLRETRTTHQKTGEPNIVTTDTYTYDHSGKVLKQTQTINGSAIEVIAENHYDELGRLDRKEVGGNPLAKLQVVDYKYNIRGWMTDINDIANLGTKDLFAFKIRYNTPTSGTALFNGNISQTEWKTKSINPTNNLVSTKYSYNYDALNRIISATDNTGNYNLTYVAYDKNGNITTLNRKGAINTGATLFGNMDLLSYQYGLNSNKLKRVTDTSGKTQGFNDGANTTEEYKYDDNGNLIKDLNKGIGTTSTNGITYNYLNLPKEVKFNNSNTKKINYTYAADGTKLRKVVNDNGNVTTTDYAGNYVYENNDLQFFNTAEGYVAVTVIKTFPIQFIFKYVYQYKDHLGNIRLSYSDADGNGTIAQSEIIEENNYYPFGLKHKGYNNVVTSTNPAQNYTYNGKEKQEELGLNWLDYGARNYDASLGRWMNVDPLAEYYYNNTPYNYVNNNPLNFVDPDGRSGIAAIKKDEDGNEYVEISAKIYFYGDQSSDKFASSTAANIQKMWNDAGGTIDIDGKSYSVKFSITGENVTEKEATKLAEDNGNNAENNFVRVTDGTDLSFKSSFFDTPGNSGLFIASEMKNGSTDAHEFGHGLGWFEKGEDQGGRHDVNIDKGVPGIMSPRGTPVSDKYGYGGQPAGSKTMSPYRRTVLASDVTKLNIDTKTLQSNGKVNVGTATNNIYNTNGTVKN
jgi:RHS repeat-associated protein